MSIFATQTKTIKLMKRFLTPLFALFAFLMSCQSPTLQERAESFAAECIKKQLYFPDSYQPIECYVDTAFAPLETPEVFEKLKKTASIYEKLNDAEKDMKRKEDRYEMYKSFSSHSSYNVYQTKEAKAEFEKAQTLYSSLLEQLQSLGQEIADLNDQPKKPYGLKIAQTYKAQTNGGQTVSSAALLLVDFDMKKVLAAYDEEDIEKVISMTEEISNLSMQQNY